MVKINLHGVHYVSQGFGQGVVSLNVRYNRQILLSAINLDFKYHLALKAQQTTFSYHDILIDKTCLMKTQAVQHDRRYHVNSFYDVGIADQQIKKNKKYARIDNTVDIYGLYRLVVNYNHVTVNSFRPSQTKEVAGVIYGLDHMGRYVQKEFKEWRQDNYSEDHGINLSDDEMALIVMLLRTAFSNRKNSLSVRMDSETFRIGFVRMITNQAPLNLSNDEAKELLYLIKREANVIFHRLNLSADALKLIYEDVVRDLKSFIHPVTFKDRILTELNKSIRIARSRSIRKGLDYIFRDSVTSKDKTRMYPRSLIDDPALHVMSDNFDNGKFFSFINVAIANFERESANDDSSPIKLRLIKLKRQGVKYITSRFVDSGKSVRIEPVNRSDFQVLVKHMRNKIEAMDY